MLPKLRIDAAAVFFSGSPLGASCIAIRDGRLVRPCVACGERGLLEEAGAMLDGDQGGRQRGRTWEGGRSWW